MQTGPSFIGIFPSVFSVVSNSRQLQDLNFEKED